jgi:tol-pal system protein YbgF
MTGLAMVLRLAFGLVLATTAAAAAQQWQPAAGQSPQAQAQTGTRTAPAPTQKSNRPPSAAKATEGAQSEAQRGGDAQLRQRIEQLEEQLVDLQVVIGTLESLAKGAGSAQTAGTPFRSSTPAAVTYSGSEAGRIDALETQIRALTVQVEQLSEQVRALDGRRPFNSSALTAPASREAGLPRTGGSPGMPSVPPAGQAGAGFGATIVTPEDDQIGRALGDEPTGTPSAQSSTFSQPMATLAPGGESSGSKQAYEAAYGYLLQQNYAPAESAFEDFLKRYPNDPLAGNAQYWLGEVHFVKGQYKAAAGAFLKGYQTYGKSAKAPESLLKLAMSLDRLGQKDAACSSYAELTTRFPNAPAHVKSRAQSERQRAGC